MTDVATSQGGAHADITATGFWTICAGCGTRHPLVNDYELASTCDCGYAALPTFLEIYNRLTAAARANEKYADFMGCLATTRAER